MLLILLNVIYKPGKVYPCVRTPVHINTSYIFYLCWNNDLRSHLLTLINTSVILS